MPRQYTRIPLAQRFWAKVDRSGGPDACWPWLGAVKASGYGHIYAGGSCRRSLQAHRVAWELIDGPIPLDEEGKPLRVLHNCPDGDNPLCVNPAHLFLGTQAKNLADMASKGRSARGEKNGGAKLTIVQVLAIREEYAAGGISQRDLARRYGVVQQTISTIVRHDTWSAH